MINEENDRVLGRGGGLADSRSAFREGTLRQCIHRIAVSEKDNRHQIGY